MDKARCENQLRVGAFDPALGRVPVGQCLNLATTSRATWRWGHEAKGEPAVVKFRVKLCRTCAKQWDENKAEARAEALAS